MALLQCLHPIKQPRQRLRLPLGKKSRIAAGGLDSRACEQYNSMPLWYKHPESLQLPITGDFFAVAYARTFPWRAAVVISDLIETPRIVHHIPIANDLDIIIIPLDKSMSWSVKEKGIAPTSSFNAAVATQPNTKASALLPLKA